MYSGVRELICWKQLHAAAEDDAVRGVRVKPAVNIPLVDTDQQKLVLTLTMIHEKGESGVGVAE